MTRSIAVAALLVLIQDRHSTRTVLQQLSETTTRPPAGSYLAESALAIVGLDSTATEPALVYFFSTSCPYCLQVNPRLGAVSRSTPADFSLIGVSFDPEDVTDRYLEQQALDFIAVSVSADTILSHFEVRATPAFILVRPDGRILWSGTGVDVPLELVDSIARTDSGK